MSPGHKWLGGLEEGFEASAKIVAGLETIPERELVDEDGAEDEPLGVDEAARGDLTEAVEDPFELAVEVLDGVGA